MSSTAVGPGVLDAVSGWASSIFVNSAGSVEHEGFPCGLEAPQWPSVLPCLKER